MVKVIWTLPAATTFTASAEPRTGTGTSLAFAAVIGVADDRWGTAIKAIVELRPGARLAEQELLRRCGESLSRYKLPKSVEFVDRLSRNALGKLSHPGTSEPNR